MKLLLSAYACAPGKGSDPEIGWNWMQQLARVHDVWVVTRTKNREAIERGLEAEPAARARFVYVDLPKALRFWKSWPGGVYLYYYIWQFLAWRKACALHREVEFDRVQHVTFCMYWLPSFMALLPVPFVWGPVGGAESSPKSFRRTFGLRGRVYESLRDAARSIGMLDPSLRMTARRATLALASTPESAERLRKLGCRNVRVESCCGGEPLAHARGSVPDARGSVTEPRPSGSGVRVFSAGRLLHWKGFHLALQAVAKVEVEYSIFGAGPDRKRLEQLASDLNIADRVHFHDAIPRAELIGRMASFDAMLHPSLHDSGGFACLEAMAAGCPVVCLDLGGPGLLVDNESGFKIAAETPEQAVRDLAAAIERLVTDRSLRSRLGRNARARAAEFAWERKRELLEECRGEELAVA